MEKLQKSLPLVGFQSQVLSDLSKVEVSTLSKEILTALIASPIIKDCSDEMIRKCFIAGMALSGIKDYPDGLMTDVIIKAIRIQHPTFTPNEINLAFELNARGLLPQRIKAFNNFDVEFVTQVLDGYMMKRLEARRELAKNRPQLPEAVPSDKDMYDGLKAIIEKTGEMPQVYNWNAVYKHMEGVGLITMTIEEKQKQWKEVYEKMKGDTIADRFKGHSFTEEDFQSKARTECRRLAVKKFFI